jgi:hypothetical protein
MIWSPIIIEKQKKKKEFKDMFFRIVFKNIWALDAW